VDDRQAASAEEKVAVQQEVPQSAQLGAAEVDEGVLQRKCPTTTVPSETHTVSRRLSTGMRLLTYSKRAAVRQS
jgi:hypothetical protein